MNLLVLYTLITLIVSFTCSLLEAVILSVSHAHIALLIKEHHRSGYLLHDMKKNINLPLSAILTLNTVANTAGAAAVAAQTYRIFGIEWVVAASAILTILILVCSEIFPKTIGAAHWKRLAPFVAYVLRGIIIVLYPIVKMLEAIFRVSSRKGSHTKMTRDELKILAEIGKNEGVLLQKEALIIENLLLLNEIRTGDILTPRAVLVAFSKDRTVGEVMEKYAPLRYSRTPVYGARLDDIRGVVYRNDLVDAFYSGRAQEKVETLMKHIHAVPDSKTIASLLDEFISRREHMFVVVDEYGGTEGIVTLEDAIETLLGVEILDERDSIEDMRAYALEIWKRRRTEQIQ